uniref:Uncharacterized protein n=1 Tax=Chloropicon primus TaxID=1764295 RepID=A0A7S2T247_9CHLO
MAAGEGGQPPGGEGEGQGKRTWSFSFKRAVNVAKGLNPIQTKRVSQIKDVAFEKVEGTKKYIQDMDISGEVRTRLYREYNERLRSIEPDLRNMGRAMGNQMLNTLLIPMNDPVEKKWREGLGIYPEMTQLVVKPILQPFVDGLWEPFDGFIGQFKSELFVYVAMSGVAGLLTGYFIGKAKRDR